MVHNIFVSLSYLGHFSQSKVNHFQIIKAYFGQSRKAKSKFSLSTFLLLPFAYCKNELLKKPKAKSELFRMNKPGWKYLILIKMNFRMYKPGWKYFIVLIKEKKLK